MPHTPPVSAFILIVRIDFRAVTLIDAEGSVPSVILPGVFSGFIPEIVSIVVVTVAVNGHV